MSHVLLLAGLILTSLLVPASEEAQTIHTIPIGFGASRAGSGHAGSFSASGRDQYASELLARVHCPASPLVWANTGSRAYHASGTPYYGRTRHGAYMCRQDADRDGFHGVKGEMPMGRTR